jgi:hypothetical protein
MKPRTLLILDTVEPANKDVDVSLLFQTAHFKDITADKKMSTITKDGNTLSLCHLYPEYVISEAVETPHYLYTLNGEKPLEKEGMLQVTARTSGVPLVMATLLTTSLWEKSEPDAREEKGSVTGNLGGFPFVFSIKPGSVYESKDIKTDALVIVNRDTTLFAAVCKTLKNGSTLLIESEEPMTFELSKGTINTVKYYCSKTSHVALGASYPPLTVTLNGAPVKDFRYDSSRKAVLFTIPSGEGIITCK